MLWWSIDKIVKKHHPSYILLENVDRLLKSPAKQRGRDFALMLKTFDELGYTVEWRVINAADKGYDSEKIREYARNHAMIAVIPRKSNSAKSNPEFDAYLYKLRHLVENAFARLKHFRSIATRFDKLARNYKAMLRLACIFIWCKAK